MVLYRRVNERRLAEARQEGREEGLVKGLEQGVGKGREYERERLREWYANLPPEVKEKLPPPF